MKFVISLKSGKAILSRLWICTVFPPTGRPVALILTETSLSSPLQLAALADVDDNKNKHK